MANPGEVWNAAEVSATVADYLAMLCAEVAGQPYSKVEHRRALQEKLTVSPLCQATAQTEERGRAPGTPGSVRPHRMRPAERATAGILGAGFILLMVIALHQPAPRMPAKATAPRSHPAVSGPSEVVMVALTAINRRDWPTLCRLWAHHDPCRGPRYRKTIAGYRLTARDVVTNLRARGDAVSGRLLAYETTGPVQTYTFSYTIKNGKITSGRSALVKTNYPWQKTPSELPHTPSLTALKAR